MDLSDLTLSDAERKLGMRFPQAVLDRAFKGVQSKDHWKSAIDAWLTDDELEALGGWDVVKDAIVHFAGGGASRERGIGAWRVEAPGYWAVIGS
jgi:hypothetical protein